MNKKRLLFNFEPPDDVVEMLDGAAKATGADRTTLIIAAIREDLPKVVKKIMEERERAAKEFFQIKPKRKGKPGRYNNDVAESV